MDKQVFITNEEREKCQRVADAFKELYELEDIVVLDAGKYGFVKLQCYRRDWGFDTVQTFTDSGKLFEDLWFEWFYTKLILMAGKVPSAELRCEDIFKCLPKEKQKELTDRKADFAKKAEIGLPQAG